MVMHSRRTDVYIKPPPVRLDGEPIRAPNTTCNVTQLTVMINVDTVDLKNVLNELLKKITPPVSNI